MFALANALQWHVPPRLSRLGAGTGSTHQNAESKTKAVTDIVLAAVDSPAAGALQPCTNTLPPASGGDAVKQQERDAVTPSELQWAKWTSLWIFNQLKGQHSCDAAGRARICDLRVTLHARTRQSCSEFTQLCCKCGCTLNCSFHICAPCRPSLFLFSKAVISDGFCSSPPFALVRVYTAEVTKEHTQSETKRSNSLYLLSTVLPDSRWLSLTCMWLLSHLSYSPEKWSLTRAVLPLNPPGAVLKRHRSNVDRNTFIGIVSPFKRRLGVALAATGRLGWLAGHLICISPVLDGPAPGWRFRQSLTLRSRYTPDGCFYLFS